MKRYFDLLFSFRGPVFAENIQAEKQGNQYLKVKGNIGESFWVYERNHKNAKKTNSYEYFKSDYQPDINSTLFERY